MAKGARLSRRDLEVPLLRTLVQLGGSVKAGPELYEAVAAALQLHDEDREFDPIHGKEKWIYDLQWVRHGLVKKGEIDGSKIGVWTITEGGRDRLREEDLIAGPPALISEVTGVATPAPEEESISAEDVSQHAYAQWLLIKLGKALGCDVWVARNDRKKGWNDESFEALTVDELPSLGFDPITHRIVEFIDVIWLREGFVQHAFEVETTTSVYSGLLRLSDLLTMQPYTKIHLYIVAPKSRKTKVIRELNRPTFRYRQTTPLRKTCSFISIQSLEQVYKDTKRFAGYLQNGLIMSVAESCDVDVT